MKMATISFLQVLKSVIPANTNVIIQFKCCNSSTKHAASLGQFLGLELRVFKKWLKNLLLFQHQITS